MVEELRSKTPWHLWAVCIVGALWNSFGCFDYFMTNTQGETYLKSMNMTEAQIAHYMAMPAWMTAVWAVGVWGAMLGTVLLLVRSKWAVEVFAASLAAYVLSLVYAYAISPPPDQAGGMIIMQLVILAGCVFFLWYARFAKQRRLIR